MILFNKFKIVLISSAFLCLCPVLGYADVSCPSGYVKISESDSIIVTNSSSCPSGHTKLSDMSGGTSVTNCTTGLSSGFCTYYSESCQSGKYFDGTTHKTCIAGSYCDGSGTATPGISGCSKACPENSTSTSGATSCTCNDGYYMVDGVCEICPIGSYCANNIKTVCDTGYTTDNTGATSESQCYTTCEVACIQQTCPDNATCTHGATVTTGKQYVGGTCDAVVSACDMTVSCNSGYYLYDGVCQKIEFVPEFTIATTDMEAGTVFDFTISAAGTFYVDWGDGEIEIITKNDTTNEYYSHMYVNGGEYTIGMSGDATKYREGYYHVPTVSFKNNTNIAKLGGSLGAIFGGNKFHMFGGTFSGCTNLTSIPETLFDGVSGGAAYMFFETFMSCTSLKNIPEKLFATVSGDYSMMFAGTFLNCTGLTGYIPTNTFPNSDVLDVSTMEAVFSNTTLDTQCPAGMYQYITGFESVWDGKVSCISCPDGCTSDAGSDAETQCYTTCEKQCTQQACPENATCTHGTTTTTGKQYVGGTCDAVASQCELTVNCVTGYELTNGTCSAIMCESGYYLDGNECVICPLGSYCANNTKTACDTGYTTDNTGASTESQCYTTCEQQCTQQECPDNATCTHGATTTTGKQYVGGTCDASASQCELNIICDKGHDKQSEIELVEQTPLIPVDYTEGGDGYAWSDLNNRWYSSNFKEAGLTKANTWASRFAYGAVYGNASCQPVSVNTESFMYISRNRAAAQNGDMSEEDFEVGLSAISGAEKAGYITKVLRGYKEGTQTQADFYRAIWTMFGTEKNEDFSTTSEGAYCHCQMTDFAPTGQSKQSVTGAWVFSTVYGDDYSCMRLCSQNCSNGLQHDGGLSFDTFRAAIFGFYSIQYETMCIINKVDIPAGYYLPANTTEPVQCPINNYCLGQTGAIFNTTETQGLKPCPDGTTSNVGASGIDQCIGGKTLHIGDEIQMNLTTVKPSTARVMVFDVLGDLYYGGLSETAKPINNNTDKQFRIYDPESNQNYWMHDYTVQ